MRKLLPPLACLLLFASCDAVSATYIQADRDCYAAVAPAHRAYVQADATLDEEQKARRIRTLDIWKMRLDANEAKK